MGDRRKRFWGNQGNRLPGDDRGAGDQLFEPGSQRTVKSLGGMGSSILSIRFNQICVHFIAKIHIRLFNSFDVGQVLNRLIEIARF